MKSIVDVDLGVVGGVDGGVVVVVVAFPFPFAGNTISKFSGFKVSLNV